MSKWQSLCGLVRWFPAYMRVVLRIGLVWQVKPDVSINDSREQYEEWMARASGTPFRLELERLEAEYERLMEPWA